MCQCASEFLVGDAQGGFPLFGFAGEGDGRLAIKIIGFTGAGAAPGKRGVFFFSENGKSAVNDHVGQGAGQLFEPIGCGVRFVRVGRDRSQLHAGAGRLGFEMVEHAGALGGVECSEFGCGPRGAAGLERGKRAHNLLLDRGDVDVANDDDGHEFRAIPRVIEIDETFASGCGNDLGVADRESLRKERAAQKESVGRECGPVADRVASPFLAQDNASFLLDFGREQEEAARVIIEDAQTFGEGGGFGVGELEEVKRALESRGGVGVAAEVHPHALKKLDERAGGIVFAAIEGHVLEKVSEPALVFGFVERAGLDEEAERSALFRLGIGAEGVAEAVGQGAVADGGIGFEIGALVGEWGGPEQGERATNKKYEQGRTEKRKTHGRIPATGLSAAQRKSGQTFSFAPAAAFGPIRRSRAMIWFYRFLFLPVLLVMAPSYLWRMRQRGGYRENFAQRFGGHPRLGKKTVGTRRVWLQAVSVGELLAIGPLIEALRHDGVEIYLTTTTSTGYRLAHDRYRGSTAGLAYFPIDWWPFSVRAWRRIAPDLVILTEGERWPEHMRQAAKRGVPVVCINARLSDRSFSRLRLFGPAAPLMLDGVTRLLPCSAQDEARFRELGVPGAQMTMTGNIKLDVQIPPLADSERAQLRSELGLADGLVLLGASTWPGEEEALLGALRLTRERGVLCSLILVPRHAERRSEIERMLLKAGLSYHFRSKGPAPGGIDVLVGDTTGELRKITQLADVVFVGKSLPPHTEGQTPVEAAALGKPILFGPGMGNFRLLSRDLLARGAAREVADAEALAEVVQELMRNSGRRAVLATAALVWRTANAGALAKTLSVIREELAKLD